MVMFWRPQQAYFLVISRKQWLNSGFLSRRCKNKARIIKFRFLMRRKKKKERKWGQMKGGGCFFLDRIYMGTFPANDSSWLGGGRRHRDTSPWGTEYTWAEVRLRPWLLPKIHISFDKYAVDLFQTWSHTHSIFSGMVWALCHLCRK